ncbi:MAG: hypothetical protein WBV22_08125 [Anaerolineaceae bacterium]
MKAETVLKRLRIFLLGFSIFIFAGAIVELLALKHYREDLQWVPLVLCPLGILLNALFLAKPERGMLKALQIGMWIIAAGGLIGTLIHVSGNLESIFEGGRSASLLNIFYMAVGGRNPLLAPGTLIIAAILSLAAIYHHPVGELVSKTK